MTESLITASSTILTFAGLLALVRFARHDTFAGASLRYHPHDELGYRYSPVIGRPG